MVAGRSTRQCTLSLPLLLAATLLALAGCGPSVFEVARAKALVRSEYPSWDIVRSETRAGGFADAGADSVFFTLKWRGPQDLHCFALYGMLSGKWQDVHRLELLRNPTYAQPFVAAFKARHPEPGLLVYNVRGPEDASGLPPRSGEVMRVYYEPLSGGPPKAEDWTMISTHGSITFETTASAGP
jgi:hypothetical protein